MSTQPEPFAFVLMPFKKEFQDAYDFGIKLACSDRGVVAERVDEQLYTETMLERIYRQIDAADFIIAEMSGQNPNVFYEVGYAHAKGKVCILATKDAHDIPFDLKHHQHLVYDGSAGDLRAKIVSFIDWAKTETIKQKTEAISVSLRPALANLEKDEWFHKGTFDLLIELRNTTTKRSDQIEAIYVTVTSDWSLRQQGVECAHESAGTKRRRSLVRPSLQRLPAGGFAQERVTMSKTLWAKWRGDEAQEEYKVKGNVKVEVATSERVQSHNLAIDVTFDELPF